MNQSIDRYHRQVKKYGPFKGLGRNNEEKRKKGRGKEKKRGKGKGK